MKKAALLLLVILVLPLLAAAEGETESVTLRINGKSLTVPADSEYVDLDRLSVPNAEDNYRALADFISSLPNLKKLDMFSTDIRRKQADALAEQFPDIEFGWTIAIPCTNPLHPERTPHRVRTDATAFSTLHNNSCTHHTSEMLSVLRYCKNLQALDIGHNDATNLDFLYDLPHLKVLILACNMSAESRLTDITPVGSLKELQYLEMFKNDVLDISCLAGCESLVDLNICFNRITDLSPLYGLKNLRRLWVYNCNSHNYDDVPTVPADEVRRLKENLPDCYIDSVSWSTDGGWREHPRYDTIVQMFWESENVPRTVAEYFPFTTLD